MKRYLFALLAFAAFVGDLSAITASKEYVDRKDAQLVTNIQDTATITLAAANAYTDAAIEGAGGVTPQSVTNISGRVTSNVVTKAYVEGLGIESGVTSVNSKTGTVVLDAADVGAIPATKTTWLADDIRSSQSNVFVKAGNAGVIGGTSKMMFFDGNSIFFRIMSGDAEGAWQNYVFPCYQGGGSRYLADANAVVPNTRKVNNKPLSSDITITASDLGAVTKSYVDTEMSNTTAIVQTWEGFLSGSNVVFSITNYISGAYSLDTAKFRVLEMTNGVYREVFNSRDEIVMHVDAFKTNDFRVATNQVITSVNERIEAKADKAWGKYTSSGGEAPSNTVYMTAHSTVFAGGLDYKRVAVGEGMIGVLTTKGAPVYTTGDEGTFKFQDDGGTNYFGFAKTDSYTLGCNTDGITVNDHLVTLTYNVSMTGVPCIWYKVDISTPGGWEQLNTPDGNPVAGASHLVSWDATPSEWTKVCYINCPEAAGFFRATIEVEGSAKFMTNMPADLGGGVLCTNTATGATGTIRPVYNGSTVTWTWSGL